MQRKRTKKSNDYKRIYANHLTQIVAYGGYDLTKNFIIVAEDKPNLYPKPNTIIALTSPDNYLARAEDEYGEEIDYTQKKHTSRTFHTTQATSSDGLQQTRYLCVVDQITENGEIVVYDDFGKAHKFRDKDVMVVELYYYMASSYDKTFNPKNDYSKSILAIKMSELYTPSEICDIIDDNNQIMYERVMLTLPYFIMSEIKDIYVKRGVSLKGNKRNVVRVCLEKSLLFGEDKDKGITPFSVECLTALNNKGYHIDVVSNSFYKGSENTVELQKWLKEIGVVYDTWNANYRYDFIVDSRNAMNKGVIDWTLIYKNITGETLTQEEDEVNLNGYLQDATERFIEENKDKKLEDFEEVKETPNNTITEEDVSLEPKDRIDYEPDSMVWGSRYGYQAFLNISEEGFQKMLECGILETRYTLAPKVWSEIKKIQDIYNYSLYPSINTNYKDLIKSMGLEEMFTTEGKFIHNGYGLDDVDNVKWTQGYEYFLTITEDEFNEIMDNGVLKKYFPLAPVRWDIISNLQSIHRLGSYEFVNVEYKELISVLDLKDKFNE